MTPLQYAQAAVHDLAIRYRWLEDSVMPGTARPYRAPRLTGPAREQADQRAREERHERVNIAPGDSPDPYHFDIADCRSDVLTLADAMAEQVAQLAGVDRMPDAQYDSDAVLYLNHIAKWLEQACEQKPELAGQVERKCRQHIERADAAVGMVTDGQTLTALCFVCGGRDETHPTGGAHTLRVRTMPHDKTVVTCEGGMCEPTTAECGIWWRGRPAWDLHTEGAWLADRLNAA